MNKNNQLIHAYRYVDKCEKNNGKSSSMLENGKVIIFIDNNISNNVVVLGIDPRLFDYPDMNHFMVYTNIKVNKIQYNLYYLINNELIIKNQWIQTKFDGDKNFIPIMIKHNILKLYDVYKLISYNYILTTGKVPLYLNQIDLDYKNFLIYIKNYNEIRVNSVGLIIDKVKLHMKISGSSQFVDDVCIVHYKYENNNNAFFKKGNVHTYFLLLEINSKKIAIKTSKIINIDDCLLLTDKFNQSCSNEIPLNFIDISDYNVDESVKPNYYLTDIINFDSNITDISNLSHISQETIHGLIIITHLLPLLSTNVEHTKHFYLLLRFLIFNNSHFMGSILYMNALIKINDNNITHISKSFLPITMSTTGVNFFNGLEKDGNNYIMTYSVDDAISETVTIPDSKLKFSEVYDDYDILILSGDNFIELIDFIDNLPDDIDRHLVDIMKLIITHQNYTQHVIDYIKYMINVKFDDYGKNMCKDILQLF